MKKLNYLVILFLILANIVAAQESSKKDKDQDTWSFLIEPYVLFPSMKGDIGLGDLPVLEVDASTSDIFNNLKMGAMLNVEANKGLWSIGTDIIYMDLKQEVKGGLGVLSGTLEAKQFAWEFSGLYRVLPWMDAGVGLRYNKLDAGAKIRIGSFGGAPISRQASKTEDWVDPILIMRIKGNMNNNILFQFRGDFGGFGIGSDFSWQIQAYAGYQFSKLFQITAGYRIIGMDYENGKGTDYFKYNVNTTGPVIRLGFNI